MNVFDFDNTIYDGESIIDFFFYYCKKDKKLLKYIPTVMKAMAKYKKGNMTVEEAISKYGKTVTDYYFEHIGIGDDFVTFWSNNMHKIKPFYKDIQSEDDLIISCSPEISLKIICEKLGIKKYIGTSIDSETGEITRLCFRENKVKAFFKEYPDTRIENFYTDSINDQPLIDISKNAYLVKGNKITKIK